MGTKPPRPRLFPKTDFSKPIFFLLHVAPEHRQVGYFDTKDKIVLLIFVWTLIFNSVCPLYRNSFLSDRAIPTFQEWTSLLNTFQPFWLDPFLCSDYFSSPFFSSCIPCNTLRLSILMSLTCAFPNPQSGLPLRSLQWNHLR